MLGDAGANSRARVQAGMSAIFAELDGMMQRSGGRKLRLGEPESLLMIHLATIG